MALIKVDCPEDLIKAILSVEDTFSLANLDILKESGFYKHADINGYSGTIDDSIVKFKLGQSNFVYTKKFYVKSTNDDLIHHRDNDIPAYLEYDESGLLTYCSWYINGDSQRSVSSEEYFTGYGCATDTDLETYYYPKSNDFDLQLDDIIIIDDENIIINYQYKDRIIRYDQFKHLIEDILINHYNDYFTLNNQLTDHHKLLIDILFL